jgi:hypothetical protein
LFVWRREKSAGIVIRLWAAHTGNDLRFLAAARDVLHFETVQPVSVANPGFCIMGTAGVFSDGKL